MKQQPGVMLYFDVRESIAQLSYAEKGMLLDAILDYGQHRQEPVFEGVALPLIWPFVRKDIHRDRERYEEIRAKRQAAAVKRWQTNEEPVQEDANASKCMQMECKPMQNMPTTTSPSSPAAAAPSTAAAAAETPAATPSASTLPRTNGSNLPDIVAQYLPSRQDTPEAIERRRLEAIARLRAMPDN